MAAMTSTRKLLPLLLLLPALASCGVEKEAPAQAQAAAPAPAPAPAASSAESFPGRDPRLLLDDSGGLHVAYVEKREDGKAGVTYRRLGADPVGPVRVSPPGLEVGAGRESPPTLDRLPDGTLVVSYAVKLPGKWSSEVRVQRSADGGKTWEEARLLHPPGEGAHSFLSSATANGAVTYAWLDKTSGKMGLRTASTRDGRAFTPAGQIDAQTCQCCGTAMAAGPGETLWLAYRDMEDDDLRDFRVLRSKSDPPSFQEGAKLSEDGWHIQGCPETGARLAPAPDGSLWAAWFTGGGEPGIYVTHSEDGGARFAPRTLLTSPERMGRHPEIGALGDGRIAVVYEMPGEQGRTLQARVRDGQGQWQEPKTLAKGGVYPRLATRGERTVLAFTCPSVENPRIFVTDWREDGQNPPDCGPGGEAEPEHHHHG